MLRVEKHVAEHPEKNYNVISTTAMINKMTVGISNSLGFINLDAHIYS